MKLLSAAANRDIYHGAGAVSILGAVVGGQHFEFGDRVGVDVDEIVAAAAIILIVRAVQIPGEGVGPAAVDRLRAIIDAIPAEQTEAARKRRRHARQQLQ